ncbi:MAG TPA: aspartate aminotransferase [Bacteroidales bacterium]|nr:MAG: aspartate aminotransferase [Bacteroidetes bacterium GWE2_42_24]OFY32406.1 MAG: aspartate aminotransferase [Bacteroidetes bacterium GWF2_43_11]HBZ68208.1 aspartate aminotransferase [Bacteroidales bacterium]
MNYLSDRVNNLSESATLAMTRLSRELISQGLDIINLSIGEPDFNTPEFVKDEAKLALDGNYTHYSPVNGYQELREAICRKLHRDNNLEFKPNQIVVSTGAKQALANTVLALVNPGDEVIMPTPYWVSYSELVKLAEGVSVLVDAGIGSRFKITATQLERAITPKSKLLMFNSPNNPSGAVYDHEELKALAVVIEKNPQLFVIADEIYEYIIFDGKHESLAQFEAIRDRVIIINGVSKGYAMTGWRLGYSASNLMIAQAINKIQGQITSGSNSVTQRAAICAMDRAPKDVPEMQQMIEIFRERRNLLVKLLRQIPGLKVDLPDGAFYVFPDISHYLGKKTADGDILADDNALCMYLLKEACVALVPGSSFGNGKCIRFSYATSTEKVAEAAERVAKALAKLR